MDTMTCYIANHQKKNEILARKEDAMTRLIERAASEEKLLKAAERIRDARVRVLRAKRALILPRGDFQDAFDAVDAKIAEVMALTPYQLLDDYV